MSDYPLRTAEQVSGLLQSLRKEAGLTQSEAAALRLGVTQQTYSPWSAMQQPSAWAGC